MSKLVCLVHTGDSIAGAAFGYFYQTLGVTAVGDESAPATQAWTTYYSNTFSKPIVARNMGISGQGLNTTYGVATIAVQYLDTIPAPSPVPPFDVTRYYILTCGIGSNDGAVGTYGTPAAYAAQVAATLVARKPGYCKVVMQTLLPRGDSHMTEANRLAYNSTLLSSGWATANSVDAIIDLASEVTMGNPATCSNTTYYSDTVHPTQAGHALLTPIYSNAISTIIGGL